MRQFGDKAREARLRWFGHVNWRDDGEEEAGNGHTVHEEDQREGL